MKIHFIGIGGIGVSALAKYYLEKNHEITGSDLVSSEITDALIKKGAKISIGPHHERNVPLKIDVVIYSPAVRRTNPELQHAKQITNRASIQSRIDLKSTKIAQSRVQILSYPQALAQLTEEHYTIAVSGTHGKSTTTAMIALILIKAGFDPTVIVGTKMKELDPSSNAGSNCRVGRGTFLYKEKPILLIEADEHLASFLNYKTDIIVLTTIEPDHLDFYKNLKNIILTFQTYISHLPKEGIIVANKDDKNTLQVIKSTKHLIQHYSAKWTAPVKLRKILKVPGEFNVANAHAALTTARALGIPDNTSYQALSEFRGTWRRFEIFHLDPPAGGPVPYTLVSDYGHHPTEVKVTLEAAREKWPKKQIWLVFQPHQYLRTFYFFRDFVRILADLPIDKLILTDIYDVAGRENKEAKAKVSSEKLFKQIQKRQREKKQDKTLHIPTIEAAETYLKSNIQRGQILVIMGAGDIYNLTIRLTGSSEKRKMK